ncbi:MAG: phenylalanine--tRNA ligase subunit beta [Armatimonadetes bacterium]|nr:phenylalanine--tRNA ligase subunit beta [Armatimonadota bacterium]
MKVSIDWLRQYIDFTCPLGELADGLTMAGLEVEETIQISKAEFAAQGGSGEIDDTVFDIKVTPNRGDWLSMIGVAREVAPLVGEKVRLPEPKVIESEPASSELIEIRIDAPELCRRYVCAVIRNVTVKESPGWLKDRIIAAGMRPINNVVDITNFVMMELGQPLHAFDLSLLHGNQIIVRRAKDSETITSIDESERKLDSEMLVIADHDRPVAIAGIMGGIDSEIGEQTKDILIESANFNSVGIRRTAKRLNMSTDASYRFERGVDPGITVLAALRAAELIAQLGGGEVCKGVVDVYPSPIEPLEVKIRPARVNKILGVSIDAGAMIACLNSLDIESAIDGEAINCKVPTFRPDITHEIDLIEEVGRVYGYDKLPMTLPQGASQGKDSPEGKLRDKLRRILMASGGQEALTHSIVDIGLARVAGREEQSVNLRNPLSEELNSMRVMLAPNLLQVIERNQAFGNQNVCVFEIGKVYFADASGKSSEKLAIAGAVVGNLWERSWGLPAKALDVDFYTCKGILESLFDGLCIQNVKFVEATDPLLHPTRAAKVFVGDREIGILGEAASTALETLGVRGRPCVFELDFHALMETAPQVVTYQEPPRYPAMQRHIAAVVADSIPYAKLVDLIRTAGGGMVEEIELLDVYKGEHIGEGQSSLTLGVVFRSREKTLTDEEVNSVLALIKDALSQGANAIFR